MDATEPDLTARRPDDLLALAREGDGAAFDALVAPYRTELLAHCYRMLGSIQDAEDALQDSLVAAWSGLAGFEQRASLRTWLYRVATNRCLTMRRALQRRRAKEWDVPGIQPPPPSGTGEVVWLEPLAAHVVDRLVTVGPDALYEQSESVSLAFITALQRLPPRQVAVLVLRDVLGYPAAEVADLLGVSVESVTSALKRARAGMRSVSRDLPPTPGSAAEQAITARFARAYEDADIDGVVALFTDDIFVTMPPMPLEYEGRELCRNFVGLFFDSGRRYRMVPTRANGQPAFGMYLRHPDGSSRATGLLVLGLHGRRISRLTRFETGVMSAFGLPRILPPG